MSIEKTVKLSFQPPTSSVEGTFFSLVDFQNNNRKIAPFKGGKFVVKPGILSKLDQHQVRECWIVAEGSGTLFYDSQKVKVSKGEYLYFESGKTHQILNDGETELVIYSLWWEPE